jgi:hypothetical protein
MSSLHIRIQIRVVGQDGAAIIVAAERPGREETSGDDPASAISTRPLAIAKRSQCLEVRRQPKQVNGDQGARLQPLVLRRAQPSLELADVDIEVGGLDEHRRPVDQCHHLRRGGEGEVGHDHPRRASCKASMLLPQATAKRAQHNAGSFASKATTSGPEMKMQWSRTLAITASISHAMKRRWAARSMKAIC